MASETWKPIPKSPGYEASDLGRIRSNRFGSQRLLQLVLNSAGYFVVNLPLRAGNRSRLQLVHHIIAETFLGVRPYRMVVMHLDDDKTNNRLTNLKYGTQGENIRAAVAVGRKSRSSIYHGVVWDKRISGGSLGSR